MKLKLFSLIFCVVLFGQNLFGQNVMKISVDNFSVDVPEYWIAQRLDSQIKFIIYSPVEENDTFQENGNLTVETLPGSYSAKAYLKAARDNLKAVYSNFNLIEEGDNFHIYTAKFDSTTLKQLQYVAIKGKEAYVFTFSSTEADFDRYKETFVNIYKSFKY